MLAAITYFQPSAIPKSFVICSRAPEMMPVYPPEPDLTELCVMTARSGHPKV
jgi:hypothetical protein